MKSQVREMITVRLARKVGVKSQRTETIDLARKGGQEWFRVLASPPAASSVAVFAGEEKGERVNYESYFPSSSRNVFVFATFLPRDITFRGRRCN